MKTPADALIDLCCIGSYELIRAIKGIGKAKMNFYRISD